MATNAQVVQAWKSGQAAKSGNGNLSTDGKSLFSYQMKIGETINGFKLALNVRGVNRYSMTTSRHVGYAIGVSDYTINPVTIANGWGSWYVFPHEDRRIQQTPEYFYPQLFE